MQTKSSNSILTNNHLNIYEIDLYPIWINFCHKKKQINEKQLVGIEPGVLNKNRGPDFQGAEFELKGKIYRGDVELHFEVADWLKHGHHLDPAYDRVLLHLVYSKNTQVVYNSKNQPIPTISIKDFPIYNSEQDKCKNCKIKSSGNYLLDSSLQSLALQRLLFKSLNMKNYIATNGFDQTLYLKILLLLGSSENKQNYERISQIVPWKLISDYKEKKVSREFWKTIFLGSAGFISEYSNNDLLKNWNALIPMIEGYHLNKHQWNYGGIRPNNFPQKRLSGLADYIWKLPDNSIYLCLQNLFYQRLNSKKLLLNLFEMFQYKEKFEKKQCDWGNNLIIEMIGNIFIPFFLTIANANQSFGLESYLKQIYLELPVTQMYGRLTKYINNQKNIYKSQKYFYCNQALLHLQNNFCYNNNSKFCPLQTFKQKN